MNANDQDQVANDTIERRIRLRFSLSKLFLLTSLICVVCGLMPAFFRWKEYRDIQYHIMTAKALTQENSNTHRSYAFLFREKQYYLVPEVLFLNGKHVGCQEKTRENYFNALVIAPLGVRITSTEEAIAALNNDFRKEDEMGYILWETTADGEWKNKINQSKIQNLFYEEVKQYESNK